MQGELGITTSRSRDEQSERIMLEMLKMGIDRRVITALLEIEGSFRVPHVRYLEGPIVISKQGIAWADTLPDWLPAAIYCDRFEQILAEHHEGKVGVLACLSEVTALMMCQSFVTPMGHEWSNVYLWAAKQTVLKHQDRDFPDGLEIHELTEYERGQYLNDIRLDIRRVVVGAAPRHSQSKQAVAPSKLHAVEMPDLQTAMAI